jgi:hypothetical protein
MKKLKLVDPLVRRQHAISMYRNLFKRYRLIPDSFLVDSLVSQTRYEFHKY